MVSYSGLEFCGSLMRLSIFSHVWATCISFFLSETLAPVLCPFFSWVVCPLLSVCKCSLYSLDIIRLVCMNTLKKQISKNKGGKVNLE